MYEMVVLEVIFGGVVIRRRSLDKSVILGRLEKSDVFVLKHSVNILYCPNR